MEWKSRQDKIRSDKIRRKKRRNRMYLKEEKKIEAKLVSYTVHGTRHHPDECSLETIKLMNGVYSTLHN